MKGQLGKFQLLREIATGGMAEIHIAKQTLAEGVEKLVVIKMLRPDMKQNREFVHMFLNEARIAARLIHPNVVQMYDLGYTDGDYYIAMEYVHGENLRSISNACKRRKQLLPLEHTLYVIGQTCRGLHHAHTKTDVVGRNLNIVHCDMSPQNIIVSFAGEVKVLDFGVAMAASRFKEAGKVVVKGKLAYMSPEQCMGKTLDARSDIFSLGILLWELVTGRRLYKYPTMGKVVQEICEGEVPSPRQYNQKIPPYLEAIIRRALSKQPEERYQSTAELQEALESVVHKDGLASSTFPLKTFMHTLFREKLEKVSQIEKAQEAGTLESVLFHDLEIEPDEVSGVAAELPGPELPPFIEPPPSMPTDPSIDTEPAGTPLASQTAADTEPAGTPLPMRLSAAAGRRKKIRIGLLVALAATIVSVIAFVLIFRTGSAGDKPDDGDTPKPPSTVQGIVRVASKPSGATVAINGAAKCQTPCIVEKLEIGADYRMTVTREGFQPWSTQLKLERAFDVEKYDITLLRIAKGSWGKVAVVTEPPGALVELDGQPVEGTTPLTVTRVSANRKHTLRASLEGSGSWTRSFTLRPNQNLRLEGRLSTEAEEVEVEIRDESDLPEPESEESLFKADETPDTKTQPEQDEAGEVEPEPEPAVP